MRFLVAALSLLVLAVANAHHTPQHKVKPPEFIEKKTHLYDVTINVTAGVPGLHPQVSKSVIHIELEIYAKSKTHLVCEAQRVLVSRSLPGVGSSVDRVTLVKDTTLESKMKLPFTAVYDSGVIKSYTLDNNESVESAKIKRTILRNLEIYLDSNALTSPTEAWSPITYNVTKSTPYGNYSSHYTITSSPYPEFPYYKNVFNITQSDDFGGIPYPAYKSHHNFVQQGCPEVCSKKRSDNTFGAGCPVNLEPHNTPMKKSFFRQLNIRTVKSGETIHDIIKTTETHNADLYDQNMEIVMKSLIRFKRTTQKTIKETHGQKSYTNLNDWSIEINEKEISDHCGYPDPREAVHSVTKILEEMTTTIIEGKVESPKSKLIGEHVILLQKALTVLKEGDLRTIQKSIVNFDELPNSSETDKVKRQIWLDILPLIGTSESVSFIVQLIKENMNKPNKAISLVESKGILESLPQNILRPSEKTVAELSDLLDIVADRRTPGYSMFYSASHSAVARVIKILCSPSTGVPYVEELSAPRNLQRELLSRRRQTGESTYHKVCPKTIAKKFVTDVTEKLRTTTDKTKRVIYIYTLATTGLPEVLKVLKPFVNGHIHGLSQSYIDYIRTVTIHSLHEFSSTEVQSLVVPIFFNKTEPPKIRTASFVVIVNSNPSLGLFQHIAEDSWTEPSEEVASFVTSTLETYGNSTVPCHQLTARRIKKILPQTKRFVSGKHHAQNRLWTMFDSVRGFGADHRFSYTPSNESFIPSHIFGAFGGQIDSFRDLLLKFSVTSQGLTSRNLWDPLLRVLNISPAEDIPQSKEGQIFPDIEILSRDPEFWRITVFEKLFYTSTFYYYDAEEDNKHEMFELLKDQITHYFKFDRHGNMEGHIVRLFIPSSYHTKAIAHTLPSTIEFEMKSPLVVSFKLKVDITKSSSGGMSYALDITPSVYYTTLYTNQYLNLGDCKDIGVYHEKKITATYPVRVSLTVEKDGEVRVSYTFPELPKTVFTYHSEAGTFAGKKKLVGLPPMEDRRTYKTIPSRFERSDTFEFVGIPPFTSQILTEDIQFGYEDIPRDSREAGNQIIKDFLNAGWRYKTIHVKRVPSSAVWAPNTEMKFHLKYGRSYEIPKSAPSTDWTTGLKFDDKLKENDLKAYSEEGQTLVKKFINLPHIMDKLSAEIEQTVDGKSVMSSYLDLFYKHTYGGHLHLVHVNSSYKVAKIPHQLSMSASYAVAFSDRPNEFNYKDETYGQQKGIVIGSISFPKVPAFVRPTIITKAIFYYKPLEKVLKHMHPTPSHEHFLPETHQECLKDVGIGKADSVPCIKAVRERSIFNRYRVHILTEKELPYLVKNIVHQVDLAVKHAFYTHMTSVRRHHQGHDNQFHVDVYYINKMTDKPVFDVVITKPTEVLKFKRVSAGSVLPVSSVDTVVDTYTAKYTNNSYPATCTLMGNYVRTYDLATFKLPREDMPSCTYILSTHCTEHKKFAVLVTIDPEVPGTQRIQVYLGTEEYVFVPGSSDSYKVEHNGKTEQVTSQRPVMFNEKAVIYASVHTTADKSKYLEFHAERAGIKIVYDGKNLKTQVHPRYKGELCGLCSEFNGEIVRELRGVDKCLYSHSSDFVKSAMVGTCADRDSVYPKICSDDEVSFAQRNAAEDEDSEPTTKRNIVVSFEDKFCFSLVPYYTCESGSPTQTESHNVQLYCMAKTDKECRKLVKESKLRTLPEMLSKPVHRTVRMDIPVKC